MVELSALTQYTSVPFSTTLVTLEKVRVDTSASADSTVSVATASGKGHIVGVGLNLHKQAMSN